jgi:hypothetical protein
MIRVLLFKTNHGLRLVSCCGGSVEYQHSINVAVILGAGKLHIAWTVSARHLSRHLHLESVSASLAMRNEIVSMLFGGEIVNM